MRVATPANEALLLDYARLPTASQLEKLCRKYALVQRHGQAPHPVGDEQHRYVRRRDTDDGMVKIEAVLHPEQAELVWTMLHHAATQPAHEPDACSHDDSAETRVAPAPRIGVTPLLQQGAGHECIAVGTTLHLSARVAPRTDPDERHYRIVCWRQHTMRYVASLVMW
jgi:hypothetical protein